MEHMKCPKFVFIKNASLQLQKNQYQILYLSKPPPSYLKKCFYSHQGAHTMTKFWIYSKHPPHASKKAVPNFVFIPNAPLLLRKRRSGGPMYQRPCLGGLELIFFQSGLVCPQSFNSTRFFFICLFLIKKMRKTLGFFQILICLLVEQILNFFRLRCV